jgi:NAD(P)-dependent dehydrogenase (short-subunit alcohol dehydrogenase family)
MNNLPLHHNFEGKVVVITGAGGVLCGDMARAYAKAGAKVAALDLNEEAVKKLADELKAEGYICEGYKANVLERELLEQVHSAIGPVIPTTLNLEKQSYFALGYYQMYAKMRQDRMDAVNKNKEEA